MPYTLSTPLQMCLIYHLNPYPRATRATRATRSYHPCLDVIRKKTVLLNTKICECDDFIGECKGYLTSKSNQKARLEAEQTIVAMGSPRGKQIMLELKDVDRCIWKVEKQLDEAKRVRREGEEYMERLGCKALKLIEEDDKEEKNPKKLEKDNVKREKGFEKERARLCGAWHIWG